MWKLSKVYTFFFVYMPCPLSTCGYMGFYIFLFLGDLNNICPFYYAFKYLLWHPLGRSLNISHVCFQYVPLMSNSPSYISSSYLRNINYFLFEACVYFAPIFPKTIVIELKIRSCFSPHPSAEPDLCCHFIICGYIVQH